MALQCPRCSLDIANNTAELNTIARHGSIHQSLSTAATITEVHIAYKCPFCNKSFTQTELETQVDDW